MIDKAKIEEVLSLLREIQCGTENMCPWCRATLSVPGTRNAYGYEEGPAFGSHSPDCRLKALIG